MSRIGYLVAVLLILGFGTYALWPTATVSGAKVFSAAAPAAFTLKAAGISAKVGKELTTVTIGSTTYELPTDAEKAGRFWTALSGMEVPLAKVISDIGEAQLPPYGIDAEREAVALDGTARVRWGGSGGQAYIWNAGEKKLFAVDPAVIAGLDSAAKPPIAANVLAAMRPTTRLTIDQLTLVTQDGQWVAELYRNRPPFTTRVNALLGQLSRISIEDLQGVPAFGLPVVGTVQVPPSAGLPAAMAMPGGPPVTFAQPSRTITIHSDGARGVVAVSGLPAQRIPEGQLAELRIALAAFARNPLLDLYTQINRDDVLRVDIAHGATPWWSLRRREKPPAIGGFYWDVAWGDGRESAPDDAVDRLAKLLADVSVRDPQPDSHGLAKLPDGALVVTVASDRQNGQSVRFAIAGGELITATHRGRLDDDGRLAAELAPERFLDQRLTRRDPSRVAKLQRRFRDEAPPRDEVVVRTEGGTWVRTYPAATATNGQGAPVSGGAVDRLIRVLAGAKVEDLVLVAGNGKADGARELLAAPDFELDVRFAAVPGGQASNDETDLDLSAAQDWGFAAKRAGPRWQCVDKDLGVRFTLDDDTIEEFRRAFDQGQVFPIVGSVVTQVVIHRADGSDVTLARNGVAWSAATGNESARPADAVAVRRYFRTVAALKLADGTALDARVPEPSASEIAASITCTVPAIGGDTNLPTEQLTLAVLRPTATGTPVHVWSNRGSSRFPRGRAVLPSPAVAEVLPDAAAFTR